VLDEECNYILDLEPELKLGQRIDSLKSLLAEDYDAIFVGCGAPRGRDLEIPGRKEAAANIHIGIDWLSSGLVRPCREDRQARDRAGRRQHRDGLLPHLAPSRRRGSASRRALRVRGDESLALGKRRCDARGNPDPQFPRAEGIQAHNGKLTGVLFEKVKAQRDAKGRRNLVPTGEPDVLMECDDVLVAVGQENAFPWIERDIGIEFDKWDMPKVDAVTMQSTNPKVFFGGDARSGPRTSSGPWRMATRPRSRSIFCATART
jgi:formate dehydrogenase beta subunit